MVRLSEVNTSPSLADLKKTYSSALYSYFRITNLNDSYDKFLKDTAKAPVFRYSERWSSSTINRRIEELHRILAKINPLNEAEIAFVEWRIAETLLLREFWQLYESSGKPDIERIDKYIADQKELYGDFNEHIFGGVIRYLTVLSHRRGPKFTKVMDSVEKDLGTYRNNALFIPKETTFLHYKHLFAETFPELNKVLTGIRGADHYSIDDVVAVFERALDAVGALKDGWGVVIADGGANVISAKYSKRLIIGSQFNPNSTLRFKQIVAHEVGCHVQRAVSDYQANTSAQFDENDEGLAVLLEQLFASRFMYKRVLRYLAICLGAGVDGKKRNFCEVYDILQRIAYVIGADKYDSKEQAFFETARAFRGGIPSARGMVYIKDKIYLESNLLVWEKLEKRLLSEAQFRKLFKGHNSELAKEIVT